MHKITVAFVLLVAAAALAQERPNVSPGTKFPVEGQYKPSPQSDPTRIIALVPVVSVPGKPYSRTPMFTEHLEAPPEQRELQAKSDSSKAKVPPGVISFRAMISDDGEWALVDLQSREFAGLAPIRESTNPKVRIFTTDELSNAQRFSDSDLPPGLSLRQFVNDHLDR